MTDGHSGRRTVLGIGAAAGVLAVFLFAGTGTPASAQQMQTGEDTAMSTCKTGLGSIQGMIDSGATSSASDVAAAKSHLDAATAAEARGDPGACLSELEKALTLLDATDGPATSQ